MSTALFAAAFLHRNAAAAPAARRDLRGVREPARPDAGQRRRPAGAIHLRDVLQSLRLERLQHPGADPVRAATRAKRSQGRRPNPHRRRRRPFGGDVLPQDHLLRRRPCDGGLCRAVPSACWPVLAGVARRRRSADHERARAAQPGTPWPTSWAGRAAAPCARRRPCTSTIFVAAIGPATAHISPPSQSACGCGGWDGRRTGCR